MNRKIIAKTWAVAVAVAVLFAGCSDSDPTETNDADAATANAPNAADVEFAQEMIPHHAQAIDMARLVAERSETPDIVALAEQIEAAQEPEIELMSGWLEEWGEDVPDSASTDHDSMDHGPMSGMMSAEQMDELAATSGEAFDRMFLELMIEHHEGAIAMAQQVLEQGADEDVKRVAEEIIEVQQAEIDNMRGLLGEPASQVVELGHIHGLGVANGTLYVATHFGLFTVPNGGAAQLVGEYDHDFMGFTVVDDETFLASGHPGSSSDLSGNLGLLESTDGGETWTSLSVLGEVDFHALDATAEAVYGADSASGQLFVSTDRTNWQQRGQIPLADLAINPTDGAMVVITTQAGPHVSTDSGASFEAMEGAPLLMLVDWPQREDLVGITPDGVVHHSADHGGTWEERGKINDRAYAMTVGPDGAIYVATEHAILFSSDGGRTFDTWYALH